MPTHYPGTAVEQRALNAYITLIRAANAVNVRIHRHLDAAGLTLGQFAALEALHHLGPLTQHVLAAKLLSSPGNLSIILTNLQRRGLVRRSRATEDRRLTIVSVTPKAERLLATVLPEHVAQVVTAFGVLTPAEQETLRALTRKLGRGQAGAPDGAPARDPEPGAR